VGLDLPDSHLEIVAWETFRCWATFCWFMLWSIQLHNCLVNPKIVGGIIQLYKSLSEPKFLRYTSSDAVYLLGVQAVHVNRLAQLAQHA